MFELISPRQDGCPRGDADPPEPDLVKASEPAQRPPCGAGSLLCPPNLHLWVPARCHNTFLPQFEPELFVTLFVCSPAVMVLTMMVLTCVSYCCCCCCRKRKLHNPDIWACSTCADWSGTPLNVWFSADLLSYISYKIKWKLRNPAGAAKQMVQGVFWRGPAAEQQAAKHTCYSCQVIRRISIPQSIPPARGAPAWPEEKAEPSSTDSDRYKCTGPNMLTAG